jgi:hypothetical protein
MFSVYYKIIILWGIIYLYCLSCQLDRRKYCFTYLSLLFNLLIVVFLFVCFIERDQTFEWPILFLTLFEKILLPLLFVDFAVLVNWILFFFLNGCFLLLYYYYFFVLFWSILKFIKNTSTVQNLTGRKNNRYTLLTTRRGRKAVTLQDMNYRWWRASSLGKFHPLFSLLGKPVRYCVCRTPNQTPVTVTKLALEVPDFLI